MSEFSLSFDEVFESEDLILNSELHNFIYAVIDLQNELERIQNESSRDFEFSEIKNSLNLIIWSTSTATNTILEKVEIIEELASHFEDSKAFHEKISNIYENLVFQDLTNQRIKKIIYIIELIEKGLLSIFENQKILFNIKNYIEKIKHKNINYCNFISQCINMNQKTIKYIYSLENKISLIIQKNTIYNKLNPHGFHFSSSQEEINDVMITTEKSIIAIQKKLKEFEKLKNDLSFKQLKIFKNTVSRILEICEINIIMKTSLAKLSRDLWCIDNILTRIFKGRILDSVHSIITNINLANGPAPLKDTVEQNTIDNILDSFNI